ncbi:MAG TPA: alpha/beta hydrolase [Polyangiaceae bacterium]|nr:alpha/beta hydrolase [Polyangiaceae bacterium]
MAEITQRDVLVDSVRSRVREAVARDAGQTRAAVVFVHGNPGSGEDWEDLVARVGDFGRAIAPDMPGFGKADRPAVFDYTVAGYARHLGGLLDRLGIDRAHLVLHDFGGPWGLAWAAANPPRVASVTLVNIGVLPGYRWHKYARIWRTPIVGELFQRTATRRAFRFLLDAENPRPLPRAFVDRMFDDLDAGAKRAILKLYRATSDVDGMSRDLGRALGPLRLPALVLWGTADSFLSSTYAERQRDFFDVRGVHLLGGCGHWPFVDEPERCASIIVPFLRDRWAEADGHVAPSAVG